MLFWLLLGLSSLLAPPDDTCRTRGGQEDDDEDDDEDNDEDNDEDDEAADWATSFIIANKATS